MAYGKITQKQLEILNYLKNEIINRGFRLLSVKSATQSV